MITRFRSEVNAHFRILIGTTILLLALLDGYILFFVSRFHVESIVILAISGIAIFLLVWIRLGTYYQIDRKELLVSCGPFRWVIEVGDIQSIRLHQKTWGGSYKAALSVHGIEIRYGRHRSLMISPVLEDKFIAMLKGLNLNIEIKEK
jgi:Protein of unknown function (DUF1200).